MNTVTRIATAFAAGAAVMYYLDPLVGRRRRALVRDKGVAAGHDIEQFARAKSRRAADRLHGVVAETKAALSATPVDDAQLRERIRSRLGRIVDAPGDIEVDVRAGKVMLRGHASAGEIEEVLDRVSLMRGVASVENHLVASGSVAPGGDANGRAGGYAHMDRQAADRQVSPPAG